MSSSTTSNRAETLQGSRRTRTSQSIELEEARAVAAPNNVLGESAMQEDKADDTMQSASNSASARVSNTLTASNTASASTGNDHSCATITVNGFAMNILRARRMAHCQGASARN